MSETANSLTDGNRPTSAEDQAIEMGTQGNESDATEASDGPLDRYRDCV